MSQKSDAIEQLAPGLSYELIDEYFYKFIFTDMSRPTVDAFVKRATECDEAAYAAQRHVRGLYVLKPGALFSPHLVSETVKLTQELPQDLRVSLAIVGDSLVLSIIRNTVFRRLSAKTVQATKFFQSEEEAHIWLEERIQELGY